MVVHSHEGVSMKCYVDATGKVRGLPGVFDPLHSHDDAFELLEAWVGNDQRKNYCVWKFWHTQNEQWVYEITLYTKHREESLVVNKSAPRAICLAVAQTVGIKVDI